MLFLVAVDAGDHAVGYLVARQVADEGEILNVGVEPKHRRSGAGRSLVAESLHQLQGQGVQHVYLEVRESNVAARELYRAFHFSEVGRRAKYYRRPVEDAILLRAAIPAVGVSI